MWARLSTWLHRVSTWQVTLLALVVFFAFSILVLPGQSASMQEIAGGVGSPDTSLFYSAADLYRMAETYGQAGRDAYLRARWTFDLVFPLVYGAFLATSIGWLFARGAPHGSPWQRANLAPVLAVLFDYIENSLASLVMLLYPRHMPLLGVLASVSTVVKWALVLSSFVLLLAGVVLNVCRWLRSRR